MEQYNSQESYSLPNDAIAASITRVGNINTLIDSNNIHAEVKTSDDLNIVSVGFDDSGNNLAHFKIWELGPDGSIYSYTEETVAQLENSTQDESISREKCVITSGSEAQHTISDLEALLGKIEEKIAKAE